MACAGCGATLGGATMYACRRGMFCLCCRCKVVVVKDYDDALRARDAQLAEAQRELSQAQSDRQREHERRVTVQGSAESVEDALKRQLAEQSAAVGLIRQYLEDRDCGYDALAMDDWDQLRNLLAPTPEPPRDDAAEPEPRPEDEYNA